MIQVRNPVGVGLGGILALPLRSRGWLLAGAFACAGVLALCVLASVRFGAAEVGTRDVLAAFFAYDGSEEHLIIRTLRVPRALIAALVGASLGVVGALMQGLTRNPLAEPGILGINAGAALAVVATVFVFGASSLAVYAPLAFVGAAVAWAVVHLLGSLGGASPMKLTVAGAALEALFTSLTMALLILSQQTLEEIRFWLAGSVAGRDLGLLLQILPYALAGLTLAFVLGRRVTVLALGEDVAVGLGQRTALTRLAVALAIVLLAGSAVAVAGPIVFAGLVAPHLARFLVGVDYRWILPYSALLGGILLVCADVVGRVVLRPQELPVGVTVALVGAPLFVYLVRWRVRS